MSRRRKHRGVRTRGRGCENPQKADSHQRSAPARGARTFVPRAWRDWIAAKKPVWRFTVLLFAGLAVFYAAYALFSASRYMGGFLRLIASISAAALSALGYEARADGVLVTGPAFAFQVVRGCDGLEPVGFLFKPGVQRKAPAGQFRLVSPTDRQMRFFIGGD